jgi:predicted aminopeptidase
MESRFGADSEEYGAMIASKDDNRHYVAFIRELAAELETVYASAAERDEKLIEKERVINAAKERFDTEYENNFSSENYRNFSSLPVNNAFIELFMLYYAEDNFFAELYEKHGKDLPGFIAAAKTIPKKGPRKDDGRERLTEALAN